MMENEMLCQRTKCSTQLRMLHLSDMKKGKAAD